MLPPKNTGSAYLGKQGVVITVAADVLETNDTQSSIGIAHWYVTPVIFQMPLDIKASLSFFVVSY